MDRFITALSDFVIEKIAHENPLTFQAKFVGKVECPHCKSKKLRIKDSFWRHIKNISVNERKSQLLVKAHKYLCLECGKYFNSRFYGIKKWSRTSEPVKKKVFRLYNKGYSNQAISDELGISYASVERYYHEMTIAKNKHLLTMQCPEILGIDEHRFSKKVGFLTTFCDLKKHRIYDVAQGKSEADLADFLSKLKGREKVKVICIDMNGAYRNLIKKWFPNAKIVSDRFHVIALINKHFSKFCRTFDEEGLSYGRGGLMRLLVTKKSKLTEKQIQRRDEYFKKQEPISKVYDFIHELCDLLRIKGQNKNETKEHIENLLAKIQDLLDTPFPDLKVIGKTLSAWKEEVARMFRFSKNNGITEGFHRKMKLIQRRAYGFRNFENYRLRVRILCT